MLCPPSCLNDTNSTLTGCGRDELLHSLRKEATSEAEGVAVDGTRTSPTLDQLDVSQCFHTLPPLFFLLLSVVVGETVGVRVKATGC